MKDLSSTNSAHGYSEGSEMYEKPNTFMQSHIVKDCWVMITVDGLIDRVFTDSIEAAEYRSRNPFYKAVSSQLIVKIV